MNAVTVVLIVFGLYLLFEVLGSVPAPFRDLSTPSLRAALLTLYVRGKDNAFLHVSVRGTKHFIRVYKRIVRQDVVRLEAYLTGAVVDDLGRNAVNEALAGYGWLETERTDFANAGVSQPVVFDYGSDIDRALVITDFILRSVLRADPDHGCVSYIWHFDRNPKGHPGFATPPTFH